MDRKLGLGSTDQTPSEAWKLSLDATCNRLMSHYLSLLRAASSSAEQDNNNTSTSGDATSSTSTTTNSNNNNQVGTDPRAGGGLMRDANDPPPPLASNVQMSALQAKLATGKSTFVLFHHVNSSAYMKSALCDCLYTTCTNKSYDHLSFISS